MTGRALVVLATASFALSTAGCGSSETSATVERSAAVRPTSASPTAGALLRGEPLGLPETAVEFDAAADLGRLIELSTVEGGQDRLTSAAVTGGSLRLVPDAGGWFEDRRGAYLFMDVDGDVVAHARITSTGKRGGVPGEPFSLAGLMAREPQPPAEISERGRADYVFITTGTGQGAGQVETKTTDDGQSTLKLLPGGAPRAVDLLLARVGSTVMTAYRNPGEDWAVARVYERPDLPARLQWGLNAYSGSANLDQRLWGDSGRYNTTPTSPDGADLVADVEFLRLYRPRVEPGQDLAAAERTRLLSLLAPAD